MIIIAIASMMVAMSPKQMHVQMVFSIAHFRIGSINLFIIIYKPLFSIRIVTILSQFYLDIKRVEDVMYQYQVVELMMEFVIAVMGQMNG